MTETSAIVRSSIAINNTVFLLAQEATDDLVARIEEAVQAGGRFVDFLVTGGRSVRALITPSSGVTIATEPVQFDPRDEGEVDRPFGSHFDGYS